jgi:hypothetical protein
MDPDDAPNCCTRSIGGRKISCWSSKVAGTDDPLRKAYLVLSPHLFDERGGSAGQICSAENEPQVIDAGTRWRH